MLNGLRSLFSDAVSSSDLSQPDLARLAGLSLRRVQQIEAGDAVNPSLRATFYISKALGIDLVDLLKSDVQAGLKKRPSRKRP